MLASSRLPRKNSEVPPCEAMKTFAVLVIAPTATLRTKGAPPSTTSATVEAVLTHRTVCHRPSLSFGPAVSSTAPSDPLNAQVACADGWYSTLNEPPGVAATPLRIRSQSGFKGTRVVLRLMVIVTGAVPGLRSE